MKPLQVPQSREAEQSLLGAALLSPEALDTAEELLDADDFFDEIHRQIFQAAVSLRRKGFTAEIVSVAEELKPKYHGTSEELIGYLTELTEAVATPRHAEQYAKIVLEKSRLRKLQRAGHRLLELASEPEADSTDVTQEAEKLILNLSQKRDERVTRLKEIVQATWEQLQKRHQSQGLTGVASGFSDLDRMTNGFQPSDLVIIAGRTSMGKTSLALSIVLHAAVKERVPTAIFSLEMGKEQLAMRMLCAQAQVDSANLRRAQLQREEWDRLADAMHVLAEAPVYVDESTDLRPVQLRSRARRLKIEGKLGLVVVDYLQLMSPERRNENRALEISEISRSLKNLARELNVPVLALSQLSRAVDKRDDKMPQLSHLRESGSIEQDADMVLFIHRPYLWELLSKGISEGVSDEDVARSREAKLIVAKHRNGPTGTLDLIFDEPTTRFYSEAKYFEGV